MHLVALKAALGFSLSFTAAQSVATFVAMTSNFFFNNAFTYRDRQLKGLVMVWGFILFCLIGGIARSRQWVLRLGFIQASRCGGWQVLRAR